MAQIQTYLCIVLLMYESICNCDINVEKRMLLDDGIDPSTKIRQMEREMQTLKSTVQELVQAVGQSESCECKDSVSNGGPTYVRWGRKDCPANSTEFVYTGMTAGGLYKHSGAAAEYVCLPMDPDVLPGSEAVHNVPTFIYGAEYEDSYFHEALDDDVPCAVCMPKQARAVIMIPGKTQCYPGWKREYYGRLGSGYWSHPAASQYVCVDLNAQAFDAGNANKNGKLFYAVEAECGSLKCPPYKEHEKLPCVVCSK